MTARALHLSLPSAASAPVAFASSSSPVFTLHAPACWRVAEPAPPWGASPESSPGPALFSLPGPAPHRYPGLPPPPRPPASRQEARALRDGLTRLMQHERQAAADFLVALADFDQRRGWEALGHQSLFDFLKRELKCSSGAASHRSAAARLIPRFPAVEAALRAGDLCLSSVRHLARVLRPENEAEYLPRFFGLSAREAEELAAELLPRAVQPRREVVTLLAQDRAVHTRELVLDISRTEAAPRLASATASPGTTASITVASGAVPVPTSAPTPALTPVAAAAQAPAPAAARPAVPPPTQVEPLSADLRRLHLTVSTRLLRKVEAARAGLAHALPGATTEQVLEAALDLLLEKQAARRGLGKRPRTAANGLTGLVALAGQVPGSSADAVATGGAAAATPADAASVGNAPADSSADAAEVGGALAGVPADRAGETTTASGARHRHIPAAVRREVWLRDGQRCQFPLDSGGTCGATHRLELDHLVPLALGGPSTARNLRVVFHNRAAAREVLGEAMMEDHRTGGWQRRAGRTT